MAKVDRFEQTEEQIYKEIVKFMKKENTYSKSYIYIIESLARVIFDYRKTLKNYTLSGGNIVVQHVNKAGHKNFTKNPLYQALEKLRGEINAYSKELGLSPSSKTNLNNAENKQSELFKFLISQK